MVRIECWLWHLNSRVKKKSAFCSKRCMRIKIKTHLQSASLVKSKQKKHQELYAKCNPQPKLTVLSNLQH